MDTGSSLKSQDKHIIKLKKKAREKKGRFKF